MADNESQPIAVESEQQIEKPTEVAEECEQQIEKSTEDQPQEVVTAEVENGGAANPTVVNDAEDEPKGADDGDDEEESEDDRKLFVGGLSWETQEKGLKEYMSQHGEIASCIVKMDNSTGRSRGFGFVVFKEIAGLDKALEARPHTVDGRKIDSKKAEPQKQEGKLFVGGVKPETEDKVITDYFSQFGKIEKIERPQDPRNKKPKGFCFITFAKAGAVTKIIKKRYHKLDEKEVECKFAEPPHEGGAGGGGRGRGRGRGGRGGSFGPGGYPMFGGDGFGGGYGFGYGAGGFGGPAYGNFGMPHGFGGYGGGMYGGGGYGYGGQQSNYGKSGRGGRFKPY